MWTVIREFLRRAPLLALILLIWLILSIVSFAGRRGPYKNYSTKGGRLPGLSLVMQGIHDHVMPWSAGPEKDRDGLSDAEDGDEDDPQDTVLSDSPQALAADGEAEKGEASPAVTDSQKTGEAAPAVTDGQKTGDAAPAVTESKDTGEAGKDSTPDKSGDSSPKTDKETAAKAEADAKSGKEGNNAEAEKKDASAASSKKAEGTGTDDRGIPASSGSRVVSAKDYGVAKKEYLSPEGTVYNTDQEGLFAPNGGFYPLQEVKDSYFSDALFVGDSRTVGLYEYGNMQSVTSFLARESTTIYALFNDNEYMDYSPKGKPTLQQRTLKDLLSKAKFKKIYLSVGVNELGVPDTQDFYEEYRKVIKKIHKLQPGAIIYIQGIMHVSKAMSSRDPVFNNTAIVQRNRAIATLANGRSIFYIDINSELCDKDGNLIDDLTADGIHLKASSCELWHSFLKKNAAVIPD